LEGNPSTLDEFLDQMHEALARAKLAACAIEDKLPWDGHPMAEVLFAAIARADSIILEFEKHRV
jgi:hypothetical protein